jgi:hypothetical protein
MTRDINWNSRAQRHNNVELIHTTVRGAIDTLEYTPMNGFLWLYPRQSPRNTIHHRIIRRAYRVSPGIISELIHTDNIDKYRVHRLVIVLPSLVADYRDDDDNISPLVSF